MVPLMACLASLHYNQRMSNAKLPTAIKDIENWAPLFCCDMNIYETLFSDQRKMT